MHDSTAPRRYLTGAIFMGAGLAHFLQPRRYQAIMPPYLPLHCALVAVSGAAEIGLGAGKAESRKQKAKKLPRRFLLSALSFLLSLALWARLPLQPLLILWVHRCSRGNSERGS